MPIFRTVHPELAIATLREAGFEADAAEPSVSLDGGCCDPRHCFVHPLTATSRDGVTRQVCGVRTNASGRNFHRLMTVAWEKFNSG